MLHTLDWRRVVHDPRFWSEHYCCRGDYYQFPGTTWKESSSWYKQIMEETMDGGQPGSEEEVEEGWTLSLAFPEGYVWQIDHTSEDEMDISTYHSLYHSTIYPEDVYPEGALLAIEGPDDHLPGLRWAELKQIATCLMQNWQNDFDVNAVVPLLYRVVQYVTFDDLEDARQTLASAWQALHVLDAAQADQWLDKIIMIRDKGQILRIDDQKEWKPVFKILKPDKEELWVKTEEGWKTRFDRSMRYIRNDTRQFLPFFSMLERYS